MGMIFPVCGKNKSIYVSPAHQRLGCTLSMDGIIGQSFYFHGPKSNPFGNEKERA